MNPHASLMTGARAVLRARMLPSAARSGLAGLVLCALPAAPARAGTEGSYPAMAPLADYLMPRDAEIALARSAGPDSITRDAEVMVFGPHGFEVAVAGHNGFVCLVQRSWASPIGDLEFWNPRERAPICFNAAAARYYVPLLTEKTRLVLAGKSKAEIAADVRAALTDGRIPALGAGAMCFMMAKGGYLNDGGGHWHPHLMFFQPATNVSAWGANRPGSPVFAAVDDLDHVTIFMVPVRHWSDGTDDAR